MREPAKPSVVRRATRLIVYSIGILLVLAILSSVATPLPPWTAFVLLLIIAAVQSDLDRFLSVKRVARQLGISPSTVWHWASIGWLPRPIKLGLRVTRWRSSDVERFLQERAAASTKKEGSHE